MKFNRGFAYMHGTLEGTPAKLLFQPEEVSTIISSIHTHYTQKVDAVISQIFSGSQQEVQQRVNREKKADLYEHLSLIIDSLEVRNTMETFSGYVSEAIEQSAKKIGLGESQNHHGVFFKVVREALGELLFDIINQGESKSFKNITMDGDSIRVRVCHNGKDVNKNFHPKRFGGSKAQTIKAALLWRAKKYDEREEMIQAELAEIKRLEKEADFKAQLLIAEKGLYKEGIIDDAEYATIKEIKKGIGEDGIPYVEENITVPSKIAHLSIIQDYECPTKYFSYRRRTGKVDISIKRSISEHNGNTFTAVLEEMYFQYRKKLGRDFNIYERVVLSRLSERWRYKEPKN